MYKFWGRSLVAAGLLLLANPASADEACLANPDIDRDGIVSEADFEILKAALGSIAGDSDFVAAADLYGDGLITTADYAVLLQCS